MNIACFLLFVFSLSNITKEKNWLCVKDIKCFGKKKKVVAKVPLLKTKISFHYVIKCENIFIIHQQYTMNSHLLYYLIANSLS